MISVKFTEFRILERNFFRFNKNSNLLYNNDFTRLTDTDFTGRFKELRIPSTK